MKPVYVPLVALVAVLASGCGKDHSKVAGTYFGFQPAEIAAQQAAGRVNEMTMATNGSLTERQVAATVATYAARGCLMNMGALTGFQEKIASYYSGMAGESLKDKAAMVGKFIMAENDPDAWTVTLELRPDGSYICNERYGKTDKHTEEGRFTLNGSELELKHYGGDTNFFMNKRSYAIEEGALVGPLRQPIQTRLAKQ